MTEVPETPIWNHVSNRRAAELHRVEGVEAAAQPRDWRRLEAPSFSAANAQVLISGNSATLLFTRVHPAVLPDGNIAPTPLREPVVLVDMSLAALKELARTASDMIRKVEESSTVVTVHSTAPKMRSPRQF